MLGVCQCKCVFFPPQKFPGVISYKLFIKSCYSQHQHFSTSRITKKWENKHGVGLHLTFVFKFYKAFSYPPTPVFPQLLQTGGVPPVLCCVCWRVEENGQILLMLHFLVSRFWGPGFRHKLCVSPAPLADSLFFLTLQKSFTSVTWAEKKQPPIPAISPCVCVIKVWRENCNNKMYLNLCSCKHLEDKNKAQQAHWKINSLKNSFCCCHPTALPLFPTVFLCLHHKILTNITLWFDASSSESLQKA